MILHLSKKMDSLSYVTCKLALAIYLHEDQTVSHCINTPSKFRVETRNEAPYALGGRKQLAEQVFRHLDIFRKRFYEPNPCISYLENH